MILPAVQYPGPGCVVEFLHSNKPQLAIVVGESGGRLRLFTQNKRETLLPAARVLPWAGPQYGAALSRNELEHILEERHQVRAALEAGVPDQIRGAIHPVLKFPGVVTGGFPGRQLVVSQDIVQARRS